MSYELTNTAIKLEVEGNTYTLRRILRKNLSKFKEKYDVILQKFMECNAAIGNFLIEQTNVNYLIDICKLIPCEETENNEFDFSLIENDYALIARLFLSESLDPETLEWDNLAEKGWKQSAISRFHLWNFEEALGKAQLKAMELRLEQQQELENKQKELEKKRKTLQTKMEKSTT